MAPVTHMIVADIFAVWQDKVFKTAKDKMPVRVADFASCEVFAEWSHSGVPPRAGVPPSAGVAQW